MFAGPWTWKRFVSFLYLAVAFWRRQLRRLVRGRADNGGERRFLENYAGEGMAPLTAPQEALVHALGRCIYCGVCEAVCPLPLDRWPAYSRALTQSRDAARSVPPDCPPDCRACADACPTHVPLPEIPAFLHRHR